jgi:transposase, IS30 family
MGRSGRPPVPRSVQVMFWRRVREGLSVDDAARAAGVAPFTGRRWFGQAGGVKCVAPQPVSGRYLSLVEREEIAVGVAAGRSLRSIALSIGRPVCTVSREVARNSGGRGYRATVAQQKAEVRSARPKLAKLAADGLLRELVQDRLARRWSPEQIAGTLKVEFPDRPEMWVSHETIYQSLYVQSRGALRRELAACLRTGRALRKPRRAGDERRGRIPGMVNIAERPAQADDRAVPGHWEGDLIIGVGGRSAIGTLVERTTRYCLLLHLPNGHGAEQVAERMVQVIKTLPVQLRRSLTWDQGSELARHAEISVAADIDIFFCDPHSPWQRGTNENTNGLLRQYFPKSTDLSVYSPEILAAVASELNQRPRKTLGWRSPAQGFAEVLSGPTDAVATTP